MRPSLRHPIYNKRTQSGVALISMLLIFALVVILVGAAAKRDQLMIRRISLQLQHSGATHNALAGEIIARQRLAEDWAAQQKNKQQSDHLNDDWATPQTLTTDKGPVLVQIRDLHGCFNLNNLVAATNTENAEGEVAPINQATLAVNSAYLARLKRLLEELDLDTDTDEVLRQVADWLDSDTQAQDGGAEEAPTGQQANANRTLEHISELAIFTNLPAMQQTTLYEQLCVVPLDAAGKATSINPNTASALLLSSWEKGLSGSAIITGREASEQGYITDEGFLSHKSNAGIALQAGDFSVRSDYFEAVIQADSSNQTRYLISRLYRDPNNGQITTLARHFSYSPSHQTLTNHQAIDESNP
jgi:general secretion pathway protein K